jgi:hypothetical protein
MAEPREVVNRAAETVGDVLESAEDRRHAWPVAIPRHSEPTHADEPSFLIHQAAQDASDRRRRIGVAAGG